jgi:hypothetical protein
VLWKAKRPLRILKFYKNPKSKKLLGMFVDFTIPLSRTGVFLVREMVNLLPGKKYEPFDNNILSGPRYAGRRAEY